MAGRQGIANIGPIRREKPINFTSGLRWPVAAHCARRMAFGRERNRVREREEERENPLDILFHFFYDDFSFVFFTSFLLLLLLLLFHLLFLFQSLIFISIVYFYNLFRSDLTGEPDSGTSNQFLRYFSCHLEQLFSRGLFSFYFTIKNIQFIPFSSSFFHFHYNIFFSFPALFDRLLFICVEWLTQHPHISGHLWLWPAEQWPDTVIATLQQRSIWT